MLTVYNQTNPHDFVSSIFESAQSAVTDAIARTRGYQHITTRIVINNFIEKIRDLACEINELFEDALPADAHESELKEIEVAILMVLEDMVAAEVEFYVRGMRDDFIIIRDVSNVAARALGLIRGDKEYPILNEAEPDAEHVDNIAIELYKDIGELSQIMKRYYFATMIR